MAQRICQAQHYGRCGGQLTLRDVMFHCRPHSKHLTRGHEPFDRIEQVILCDGHFDKIIAQYENNKLPELYGWDFVDALDGLTYNLVYTGREKSVQCAHCSSQKQLTLSETGACSDTCIELQKLNRDHDGGWKCMCNSPLECVCASFNNNILHWALLTYMNGFDYFTDYDCPSCYKPSWMDSYDCYFDGLVKKKTIIEMAWNPLYILQKNANGKTPMDLISPMIDALEITLKHTYLKCAELGWLKYNILTLKEIQKSFTEILDTLAN